uniref:RING-type domain-containing protein n=1 Tax=Macrostomum lignano TaxID=282301 RepID=A0A1I8IQ36_9PLAT
VAAAGAAAVRKKPALRRLFSRESRSFVLQKEQQLQQQQQQPQQQQLQKHRTKRLQYSELVSEEAESGDESDHSDLWKEMQSAVSRLREDRHSICPETVVAMDQPLLLTDGQDVLRFVRQLQLDGHLGQMMRANSMPTLSSVESSELTGMLDSGEPPAGSAEGKDDLPLQSTEDQVGCLQQQRASNRTKQQRRKSQQISRTGGSHGTGPGQLPRPPRAAQRSHRVPIGGAVDQNGAGGGGRRGVGESQAAELLKEGRVSRGPVEEQVADASQPLPVVEMVALRVEQDSNLAFAEQALPWQQAPTESGQTSRRSLGRAGRSELDEPDGQGPGADGRQRAAKQTGFAVQTGVVRPQSQLAAPVAHVAAKQAAQLWEADARQADCLPVQAGSAFQQANAPEPTPEQISLASVLRYPVGSLNNVEHSAPVLSSNRVSLIDDQQLQRAQQARLFSHNIRQAQRRGNNKIRSQKRRVQLQCPLGNGDTQSEIVIRVGAEQFLKIWRLLAASPVRELFAVEEDRLSTGRDRFAFEAEVSLSVSLSVLLSSLRASAGRFGGSFAKEFGWAALSLNADSGWRVLRAAQRSSQQLSGPPSLLCTGGVAGHVQLLTALNFDKMSQPGVADRASRPGNFSIRMVGQSFHRYRSSTTTTPRMSVMRTCRLEPEETPRPPPFKEIGIEGFSTDHLAPVVADIVSHPVGGNGGGQQLRAQIERVHHRPGVDSAAQPPGSLGDGGALLRRDECRMLDSSSRPGEPSGKSATALATASAPYILAASCTSSLSSHIQAWNKPEAPALPSAPTRAPFRRVSCDARTASRKAGSFTALASLATEAGFAGLNSDRRSLATFCISTELSPSAVALAAASLPSDAGYPFHMPAAERFDSAAHGHQVGVLCLSLGRSKRVLDPVQADIQSHGVGQQRNQGPLLQLVGENWSVGFASRPDSQAGGGVAQSDGQAGLDAAHAHAGNADSAGEQLVGHGQEASSVVPRHPDRVEGQLGIVHPVQAHPDSHIVNVNARHRLKVVVSNPSQNAVHSALLAVDAQLGEHNAVLGVQSTIGDPVLLRQRRRAVDNEFTSLGIVLGRGLHLHGVVAVAQLRQAEAADVVKSAAVMPLGAQLQHCAAEQVELDLRAVGRGRAADHGDEPGLADFLQPLVGQLAVLLQADIVARLEQRVRRHEGLHLVAHLVIVVVQNSLQLGGGRGRSVGSGGDTPTLGVADNQQPERRAGQQARTAAADNHWHKAAQLSQTRIALPFNQAAA